MAEAIRVEEGIVVGPARLEAAYRALHDPALRWAGAITRDSDAAEDVVQDAFVRVFSKLRPVRDCDLEFYVRRAVVNMAISWVRSEDRRRGRERRAAAGVHGLAPSSDGDGELWLRVQRLPRRQFTVIALRYWLDLTETETARLMGCRPGTVKSLSFHAITTLRSELGDA
jgi:DNA-directed RNA polymerase specialized sigma24 family protein